MDNESAANFTTNIKQMWTQLVGLCLLNIQISIISKGPLDPQARFFVYDIISQKTKPGYLNLTDNLPNGSLNN